MNMLSDRLSDAEKEELARLTREKYAHMESATIALMRLDAALIKHFDAQDARELQELARHAIGLYVNTHQYHNAVHGLSMTREALHLAEIAGITDKETLRTLVIQGLYHDTGNGTAPVAPDRNGDEVHGVAIFMRDLREAQRRASQGESVGALAALTKLTSVRIKGESVDQVQLVAACIASTVFPDRFALPSSLAQQKYMGPILEHLHNADNYRFLHIRHMEDLTELMESAVCAIVKSADIAGSTYEQNVLSLNLLNRVEDVRRGLGHSIGPRAYHNGFIGFLGAGFHKGPDTPAVTAARNGSPLFIPADQGNAEELMRYGKSQLEIEGQRFEKIMSEHESMLTALFVLIGESNANGENFLTLPLREIANRLEDLANDGNRIDRAQAILQKETIEALDLDLNNYPLLRAEHCAALTIPEMRPGLINRIFAPNTAQTQEQNEVEEKLDEIQRNADVESQPVLTNVLELADMSPDELTTQTFGPGETMISKDSRLEHVLIILDGNASVMLEPDNRIRVGPGTLLGEMSVLTGNGAIADVIADSEVSVVRLPASMVANEYRTEELKMRAIDVMQRRIDASIHG